MIRFGLIIPTYNRGHVLPRAVASAFESFVKCKTSGDGLSLVIVIVDDGSTDDTQKQIDILKTLAPSNVTIVSMIQSNGGPGAARNLALDYLLPHESSPLVTHIAFLDSDDCLSIDFFPTCISNLEADCIIHFSINSEKKDGFISGLQAIEDALRGSDGVCAKLFPARIFDDLRFPPTGIYEDYLTIIRAYERVDKILLTSVNGYIIIPEYPSQTRRLHDQRYWRDQMIAQLGLCELRLPTDELTLLAQTRALTRLLCAIPYFVWPKGGQSAILRRSVKLWLAKSRVIKLRAQNRGCLIRKILYLLLPFSLYCRIIRRIRPELS